MFLGSVAGSIPASVANTHSAVVSRDTAPIQLEVCCSRALAGSWGPTPGPLAQSAVALGFHPRGYQFKSGTGHEKRVRFGHLSKTFRL